MPSPRLRLAARVLTPPLIALGASLALLAAAPDAEEPAVVQIGDRPPMTSDSAEFVERVGVEPDGYLVDGDVAIPRYELDCEERLAEVPAGTPVECSW